MAPPEETFGNFFPLLPFFYFSQFLRLLGFYQHFGVRGWCPLVAQQVEVESIPVWLIEKTIPVSFSIPGLSMLQN